MDSQNISRKDVKHRRGISLSNQNQRLPREKVDIPDDTWLEALKFLTCPEWSQKRFVSLQINGIAERNISRLPKMILESANMYRTDVFDETELEKLPVNKYTIVAFDTVMQEEQSTTWLKNRGFTLDALVNIPPENALLDAEKWTEDLDSIAHIVIFGSPLEKIPLSKEEINGLTRFPWFDTLDFNDEALLKPQVMYYAQFNPVLNQYSWDYLAQFLKLLYHPTSYIKEVVMYVVNQSFIDSLKFNVDSFDNGPRYIQCESFWLGELRAKYCHLNVVYLPDILKWLAQNVRAETIHISWNGSSEIFVLLSNFVFDASGAKKCASKEIEIGIPFPTLFLNTLIEKFHTIPLVETFNVPLLTFGSYLPHSSKELNALLGPNLIAQEVDSEGAVALYMIYNGENRMRISLCRSEYSRHFFNCKVRIYSV